ncbi:MAG: c-type cytochrome [Deltaproteobacteria bacterium]|nr:c-type cytochrome [Deltaproteobacteria bacterium]
MPPLNLSDAEIDGVLAYVEAASAKAPAAPPPPAEVKLSDADFAKGKDLYFNRCAGCHGTLRTGATGPTLEPKRTKEIGTEGLKVILQNGTPGGMPPFGRQGILTAEEIEVMAGFLQLPPPTPPQLPIEKAKESWKLVVPVAERPTKPDTKRDWQDYFGVVFRDAGQVGIFDGKSKELVGVIDTGFAVHILRSSSTGRYFYAVGRDGRVTMIDLWPEKPTLVAQVQGCYDARSVDSSKYKGFEDKLLIEGCYWPPQYVVMDGQTLEPLKITDVTTPAVDTNEPLTEVRVASIIASHFDPLWVVSLKEAGYVALVDYSKPDFPIVSKIPADRFLHDGGWDHSKRYFMVAANMRNKMAIVDVKDKKLVTTFETGIKPHPGRGANWRDPKFGWVNGTTHIGEGKLVVYGADPVKKPEHAWKVVRELKLPSAGGLFVKTHEKSPWVWIDMPLSNDATAMRNVCVYSKAKGDIEKCWTPSDRGRALHFEYNKDGSEVWLSTWDKSGELIVYDDKTLAEKTRIKGDYMVTPTGKFNVYNTAHDVY